MVDKLEYPPHNPRSQFPKTRKGVIGVKVGDTVWWVRHKHELVIIDDEVIEPAEGVVTEVTPESFTVVWNNKVGKVTYHKSLRDRILIIKAA